MAFLVVFAAGASKPLLLDNMDFPAVAEATSQSGVPVYYRGEQNPNALGLYHPPLYIYLLAGWFKIMGTGAAAARMFGAVCALLQGAIALLLLRELFGARLTYRVAPYFWVLFLLNAYTIQTASIADIDSTIYGPLLCLFLWTVIRLMWRQGEWHAASNRWMEFVYPILVLTACLWSKLTTVLLVIPFTLLLLVPRFGWPRAAVITSGISAAAVLAFAATYSLYGWATGLPVSFTFSFTLMSFRTKGSSGAPGFAGWLGDRWRTSQLMIPFMVRWTGLIPWVIGIVGAIAALWTGLRRRDARYLHAALILLLALGTTGYYCAQTPTFGSAPFKYPFVYWAIVVAAMVATVLPHRPEARESRFGGMGLWLAIWCLALAAGATLIGDRTLTSRYGPAAAVWPVLVPATAYGAGLVLQALRIRPAGVAFVMGSLAVYGGFQAGMGLYQNAQQYATTYDYGETGFLDTVAFVRTHTRPDEIIASMKDVGFAAQRRYFETYGAINGDPQETQRLKEMLVSGAIRFGIYTVAHGQDQLSLNPPLKKWIFENCATSAAFGDYRIYRCTPS